VERIEKIKLLLEKTPKDSFLQHALALEYIKLGRDALARTLFEAVITEEATYVGTYYHLAKLYERMNENALATQCYQKGMQIAKALSDNHTYSELSAAYEELTE
jgi:Tfp pilus assembly protein PilF